MIVDLQNKTQYFSHIRCDRYIDVQAVAIYKNVRCFMWENKISQLSVKGIGKKKRTTNLKINISTFALFVTFYSDEITNNRENSCLFSS